MILELRKAAESEEPFLWEMLYLAVFVPPGAPPIPRSILSEPALRGIGSRLLKQLIGHGDALSLSCDPENPARRLYLRVGFEPQQNERTKLKRNP